MKRQGADVNTKEKGTLLLVANFAPDVGFAWWLMENFWVELAQIGRAFGLSPVLVYPESGKVPDFVTAAKIETEIFRFPGSSFRDLARSLRWIRERRVRCIYFTDRSYSKLSYALLRAAGVRLMLTHDHTPGDRPPIGGLKGSLKSIVRRIPPISCDLQICVSPLMQERAVRNARIPREKTVVVQNGIPQMPCRTDRDYASRALDIPRHSLICMTIARASPYKRIDFAIEVARHCIFELDLTDLYFVHCGDGPDMNRLQSLVARYELEERFLFAGRRTDVQELLCSADFALHPAQGEGFSLAILEYMRAQLAVLVPSIPSVQQAIVDGKNGLVYEDGNVARAAELLAELQLDPIRRRQLGTIAAEDVRTRYSFDKMNQTFRAVVSRAFVEARL